MANVAQNGAAQQGLIGEAATLLSQGAREIERLRKQLAEADFAARVNGDTVREQANAICDLRADLAKLRNEAQGYLSRAEKAEKLAKKLGHDMTLAELIAKDREAARRDHLPTLLAEIDALEEVITVEFSPRIGCRPEWRTLYDLRHWPIASESDHAIAEYRRHVANMIAAGETYRLRCGECRGFRGDCVECWHCGEHYPKDADGCGSASCARAAAREDYIDRQIDEARGK